jgi:hypothetical protein
MSLFGNRFVSLPTLLGLLVLILASSKAANAQEVYVTRFEDPPFIAGLSLVGQDGWIAPALFSPNAAVISTDKFRQGKQSVRVAGADLVPSQDIINLSSGFYDAIGSYRKPVNFDTGGNSIVRISTHVRLDGPQTPGNLFFAAGIAARLTDFSGGTNPGTRGIGQIDVYSDGNVYVHDGNRNVPLFLTSAPITLGEWHELALIEDVGSRTFTAEVDGVSLGTFAYPPDSSGSVATNVIARGALLTLGAPDTATLKKEDYVATFDHFRIQATGKR